ncbi:MAG TPA: hypothetical protein VF761_13935 [Gemmatimonadaceae bacterium]
MYGFSVDGGPASAFGLTFAVVAALVLIAAWVILGASRFVQGGIVERAERVPQLYGYTACLIGLVWALTSAVGLVNHLLERSTPTLASQNEFMPWSEPSITSFEAFRITYDRRRFGPGEDRQATDTLPEAELRRRFEALRADRIAQVEYRTRKEIISSLLGLVLGGALFLFHWRWVHRRTREIVERPAQPPLLS